SEIGATREPPTHDDAAGWPRRDAEPDRRRCRQDASVGFAESTTVDVLALRVESDDEHRRVHSGVDRASSEIHTALEPAGEHGVAVRVDRGAVCGLLRKKRS